KLQALMNASTQAVVALFANVFLPVISESAPGPVLTSRLTGNSQVEVSWAGENFGLEKTLSLKGPASWQPVPEAPTQQGGVFTLILPAREAAQFFRLRESQGITGLYVSESSPADSESGVAVTRETILRFNGPIGPNSLLDVNHFHATSAGRRLL